MRLLVSEIFPPKIGGSGRWFWEVFRRLPTSENVIAAGCDPRQDAFDRSHDLNVVRLPLALKDWSVLTPRGLKGYLRAVRALKSLARREHVTVVFCGRCLPEGLMGLALKIWMKLPYVCFVHGEEGAPLSREYGWLVKRVFEQAEFLVANTQNTMHLINQEWRVQENKLRLLHPGVDTTRFVPAGRDPARREAMGWGDRPVVLTVSRLQLRKGHDQLIAAIDHVRQSFPDVLYSIAGDGEERNALEALVSRLGLQDHVQFLGEINEDELLHCYQQCDLFVLPNRTIGRDIEGFGIVLLEAQSCGKPVIAGESGGTKETMDESRTGFVVPCDEPDVLARKVAELLGDPERRTRMGMAAREWVVQRFDWDSLAHQAELIFRRHPTYVERTPEPAVRT